MGASFRGGVAWTGLISAVLLSKSWGEHSKPVRATPPPSPLVLFYL